MTDVNSLVKVEEDRRQVAVLTLGGPEERVVTFTPERMESLRMVIRSLKDKNLKGLVFMSSSPGMFSAGADINLISSVVDPKAGEEKAREGQMLFDEIQALPFPTVAAISGVCVGGACEMVLACGHRIISSEESSVIGLPEVKLGILPGFGGTQRLPRLIGLPRALDIILAGKTLKAKQALKVGLVDLIVPFDRLKEVAIEVLLKQYTLKCKRISLIDRALTFTNIGRSIVSKQASAKLYKQTKGFYPAPVAALQTVLYGLKEGLKAGYKKEAEELGRLVVTPESKALVNLFYLTEASKGLGKSAKSEVKELQCMVVGAGAMGAGIAGVMAKSGYKVSLKDQTKEGLDRGIRQIEKYLASMKYLSGPQQGAIRQRISGLVADVSTSTDLSAVDFVVEAIFEDLGVKQKVFRELSPKVKKDALLLTNTSSLSVTSIAEGLESPERVAGLHFFNPVEKMPLVEIVRGEHTSDKTIALLCAFTVKLGKFPIVVKDVPGFLVNRILSPYLNEAAFLISEGVPVEKIDKAALSFGMPMGPVRLLDEVGLDIAAHVADSMRAAYPDRMNAPQYAKKLSDLGMKGRKSGQGFYKFGEDRIVANEELNSVLELSSERASDVDMETIQKRLLLSLVNEAVRCLDEGVAGVPGPEAAKQVDLGTVMGIGFPAFRGGLLYYANTLGVDSVLSDLDKLSQKKGFERFTPWSGLRRRLELGKNFHDSVA